MVRRWRFFASFLRIVFQASRMPHISDLHSKFTLEMWPNAQRDGRPGEVGGALYSAPQSLADAHYYMPCSNAAKTRRQLKFGRVPQTSKTISAASGPNSLYCGADWRTYCCLTSFFPIVDTCLSCEDIARQSCAMVPRW